MFTPGTNIQPVRENLLYKSAGLQAFVAEAQIQDSDIPRSAYRTVGGV